MIRFGTLKRFWVVWVLYWLVYLCQPVRSVYQHIELAWLLQFMFVMALSLAYITGACLPAARPRALSVGEAEIDQVEINIIIRCGLWISFFGLVFLAYDKIVVQGVDYSLGLAAAREQWRRLGEGRNGQISSPFSAFGYLFGGAFFLSLALTLSRRVLLPDSKQFSFFLFGFFLLMANSLVTGGRSSILLAVAFISFEYFSSRRRGLPPLWRTRSVRKLFAATGFFTVTYIFYVFYSRAVASRVDMAKYSLHFLKYLGLEPIAWFADFATSSIAGSVLALVNLAVSYLTHSLVTTAAIIGHPGDSGDAIFFHLRLIGAKIGLCDAPAKWFLAGRFPSLPGALYMQFGLTGLFSAASLIGMIAGFFCALFDRRPSSVILILVCASIESILLLSPFLFAGDFMFFPFMLVGGVIAILLGKNIGRQRVQA
jgi:hypothetical protein